VAAAVARLKTLVATAPFPPQVRRPRYTPPPLSSPLSRRRLGWVWAHCDQTPLRGRVCGGTLAAHHPLWRPLSNLPSCWEVFCGTLGLNVSESYIGLRSA
jgi:hypothetical protein